jgi:hypothetical protein
LLETTYPVMERINTKISNMTDSDLKQLNDLLDRYLID